MDFLLQTPYGWYFRRKVPAELREQLGKREIKRSLNTTSKKEALAKARLLLAETEIRFMAARNPHFTGIVLEGISVSKAGFTIQKIDMNPDKIDEEIAALEAVKKTLLPAMTKEPASGMTVKDVADLQILERETAEAWTSKTKYEISAALDLVADILGNPEISTVTRTDAVRVVDVLKKLPINRSKDPVYRGKTVAQILRMSKPAKTLSIASINKCMVRASSLWAYAQKQHLVTANPFSMLQLKSIVARRQLRNVYTPEDLRTLFENPSYSNLPPEKYWPPLIARYTGARLNEICQLDTSDVYQEHDFLVISINDNGNGKKLKTLSSARILPVPAALLQHGFDRYCLAMLKAGHTKLFPALSLLRDGYGQLVSKWYGRYLKKAGLIGVDFHSFRHTVATELKHLGVEESVVADILGHSLGSETGDRYSKAHTVQRMKEALDRL
jgi:integrase